MNEKLLISGNQKGYFCFLSNLKEFLDYYEFNCTESWIGGIIGFMGFCYIMIELPSKEVIHGRNANFDELFQCLQERLDLQLIGKEFYVEDECMNTIEEILKTKNPLLIWVDQYYLEYSTYFNMAHYWSLVNVTGIRDDCVNLYDYETRCVTKEEFLKSICCSKKARIYYKDNRFIGYKYSEKEAASAGLKRVIEMMQNNSNEGEHYGIKGMEYFMDHLLLYNDNEEIYNICYQLNRASGVTATRRSMCTFLEELKSRWSMLDTEPALKLYTELCEGWKMVGNLIFKFSVTMDKELGLRIKERIRKLINLEKEGIYHLKILVQSIEEI